MLFKREVSRDELAVRYPAIFADAQSGAVSDKKKSVIEIVTERMEKFFAGPAAYDGPFSGITYGDVAKPHESESLIDAKDLL